jgi:hypothetical protein
LAAGAGFAAGLAAGFAADLGAGFVAGLAAAFGGADLGAERFAAALSAPGDLALLAAAFDGAGFLTAALADFLVAVISCLYGFPSDGRGLILAQRRTGSRTGAGRWLATRNSPENSFQQSTAERV